MTRNLPWWVYLLSPWWAWLPTMVWIAWERHKRGPGPVEDDDDQT